VKNADDIRTEAIALLVEKLLEIGAEADRETKRHREAEKSPSALADFRTFADHREGAALNYALAYRCEQLCEEITGALLFDELDAQDEAAEQAALNAVQHQGDKMRTSGVLRALADQLDALGDVLNHPITVTTYDFGYKHEVAIQPFGDDDQRDVALVYALATELGAEANVRTLDETKVSVQFATKFSGVKLEMFSHADCKAADRAAHEASRPTLAEQWRKCGAEQAAQDAEADAFHAQRRADEAEDGAL